MYLIKNASVVNEGEIFEADVLIADGVIKEIFRAATGSGEKLGADKDSRCGLGAARIIDATGKYLIPGIIDEHVHFREPGLTAKGDIYSESRAAVAGGVTSFMDMPNTQPQTTSNSLLEEKFRLASEKSLANYSFYIGAAEGNLDELLHTDYSKVCGIKLFMGSSTGGMLVDSDSTLEGLFREAPCLIAAHCEDEGIIRRNTECLRTMLSAGQKSPGTSGTSAVPDASDASVHARVRSAEACFRSSARAVELAEKTGARLHILHISSAEELSLFRSGLPLEQKRITAETCPHYLTLDENDYKTLGFAMKCNPSIKSADDRKALLGALGAGLIDCIGTDHAPHLKEEKLTGNYFTSKSGFPSVQHSLQLMTEISREGWLSLPQTVALMCHNPAVLYRIERRGFIRKGYHADLALVDMNCDKVISESPEFSKCGWTPYGGRVVHSEVTHTFVGGNLVYENGLFHEEFRGERLSFLR